MAFHFVTNKNLTLTSLLIASNITPSLANDVLIIMVQENELNTVELQGENVFRIVHRKKICYQDEYDSKKICADILENGYPMKIILSNLKTSPKRDKMVADLKAGFATPKLIVFENFKRNPCKTVHELTKSCQSWRGKNPYFAVVQSCRNFVVGKYNSSKKREPCNKDIW
uniref:Uncharacterized protein n=1 Tax=Panagrolaimus sp. ES5 TaxID=591445 RepID=A0AC34FGB3_9BILA